MISTTDWSNHTTNYGYADKFFTDSASGNPIPYTSSPQTNAYLTSIAPPLIPATTLGYYFGTGQLAEETDPNGNTSYEHYYDYFNRLTATSSPDGGWTLTEYVNPEIHTFTGITNATPTDGCTASSGNCREDATVLDGLGRVSQQILVTDPSAQTAVGVSYDLNGRVQSVTNPHRSANDPTYGVESYTYDGMDRLLTVTRADNSSVLHTHYGTDVVSYGGVPSPLCSGVVGYPILTLDESGNPRQVWIDAFGRTVEADEPDATTFPLSTSLTLPTCYSYDLNNNLTGVVQGSLTRTYQYDLLSRLISSSTPESGATGFAYDQEASQYCPSPNSFPGNLVSKVDARGVRTCYQYDALNRLTNKNYSDGTPSVTYIYDSAGYGTNPKGRLSAVNYYTPNISTDAFGYDKVGRVSQIIRNIEGLVTTTDLSYNYAGLVNQIGYASGRQMNYSYNNASQATTVQEVYNPPNWGGATYASNITYQPEGDWATMDFWFGSLRQYSQYNNRLWPTSFSAQVLSTQTNLMKFLVTTVSKPMAILLR